uniref:CS domain-containing protein n=1 Tax=Arcella intermedia TaxID=1963864 RepID=A0A6B2L6B7_9EUKA
MSAESLIAEANALFVEEEYQSAMAKFNQAIELDDKNSSYFTHRSFCHYKLENYTAAMADAKKAVELDPKNAKAFLRKGMAAFSLEEYESAKEAFEKSQELAPAAATKTWIRKCEAELETEKDDDESSEDIAPKKAQAAPKAMEEDGPPPLEPDTKLPPKAQTPAPSPSPSPQPAPVPAAQPAPQPAKPAPKSAVRYEWYQTETHVTVTIYLKNVKKEDASVQFQDQHLDVAIQNVPVTNEYRLNVELSDKIITGECVYTVLGTKIEIKLKKSKPAKWPALENTGTQVRSWDVVADQKTHKGLAYPSSSKHGAKDWDALGREQPEEKLEGDAALNKVFADIYKGASDEQRKAMLKSFQESGGTVLSTNWDEVGKGEVKGQPPKGMEMHNWKEIHE